jgi:Flp pilus assembly protein CpaB
VLAAVRTGSDLCSDAFPLTRRTTAALAVGTQNLNVPEGGTMKQKNVILMFVAVGCGLVAAFLTTQINAKGPKIEQVEVLVAAKDLAVGTQFTKTELPKLITKKLVNKDSLPPNFVNDENDLLDKRLSTSVQADMCIDPKCLSTRGVIILPEGKDMYTLSLTPQDAAAGFAGPGAHVDVLATLKINNKIMSLPILVDMQILAVDTKTAYDAGKGAFASMGMVSLAVTQEQALLLSLASQRGCHMRLLLRNPSKPIDPTYDIKRIIKLLQDDNPGGILATEDKETRPSGTPRTDFIQPEGVVPPFNPDQGNATTAKVEAPKAALVKVFKANADIAVNTEITKDLISQSFVEKEISKDNADLINAYPDLTPFLGQVFKTPVAKDQVVIKGMIGSPVTKVAPPELFLPPKPEPTTEVKKEPKTTTEKRTYDVAWHTSNGTEIHRYEEYKPGEYRLQRVMSPAEAAQDPKQLAAPGTQTAPNNQVPASEPRKID